MKHYTFLGVKNIILARFSLNKIIKSHHVSIVAKHKHRLVLFHFRDKKKCQTNRTLRLEVVEKNWSIFSGTRYVSLFVSHRKS